MGPEPPGFGPPTRTALPFVGRGFQAAAGQSPVVDAPRASDPASRAQLYSDLTQRNGERRVCGLCIWRLGASVVSHSFSSLREPTRHVVMVRSRQDSTSHDRVGYTGPSSQGAVSSH